MESTKDLNVRERLVVWPLIVAMLVLGIVPALALDYLRGPSAGIVAIVSEEAGK
jgi:NADH-quinone oxidoreductase subunit M